VSTLDYRLGIDFGRTNTDADAQPPLFRRLAKGDQQVDEEVAAEVPLFPEPGGDGLRMRRT
jgi:hypothetical protein